VCEQCQHSANHLRRRSFLKVIGSASAVGVFGGDLVSEAAHADALTKAQRDEMSPSEIIDVMKKGNERFRSGVRQNRNYLNEQKASASGQYPAAVLLSCIDSRAPAEVIMDLGLGDIFNCRVAGNVANPDILGSMEFACKLAGAKVVLVMGHTACGAIKGAIDNAELGNLTGLFWIRSSPPYRQPITQASARRCRGTHECPNDAGQRSQEQCSAGGPRKQR